MNKKDHFQQYEDVFARNRKFPRAENIFAFNFRSIDEIKDNAVFVVDTDVLLYLYEAQIGSIQVVQDLYNELISLNRFFVPAQVAREFADKRGYYLKQLNRFVQEDIQLQKPKFETSLGGFPSILKSFPEFDELKRIEKEIESELENFKFKILFAEYQKKIDSLMNASKSWLWSDPVSTIYQELFRNQVVVELHNLDKREEELIEQVQFRSDHQIPPIIHTDQAEDKGLGEYLKWQSILQLGKDYHSNVIFITADNNLNWFDNSNQNEIYPRHELCYEFTSHTKGLSFNIMTLTSLLKLFNFDKQAIKDISKVERKHRMEEKAPLGVDWLPLLPEYFDHVPKSSGILMFRDKNGKVVNVIATKKLERKLMEIVNQKDDYGDALDSFAFQSIEDKEVAKIVAAKLKSKYHL